MKALLIILASVLVAQLAQAATPRTVETAVVVSNPGFEEVVAPGATRPPYWFIGTKENNLTSGSWSIDAPQFLWGRSLRLNPAGEYYATQILHVPGTGLAGKTINFKVRVKHLGMSTPPAVILYALNPEIATINPLFGAPGFSAATAVAAPTTQGIWHTVTGSITSPTETLAVAIMLVASSPSGTAWFDQVEVYAPTYNMTMFRPSVPALPITKKSFDMGFTSNAPMDSSERGYDNLIYLAKNTGNLMNFFVPIQWCYYPGQVSCDNNIKHQNILKDLQKAKALGLKVALTFNFTHANIAGVGDLNPLPNGASPGTLLDQHVLDAMTMELFWLIGKFEPNYIMTGIEMDIMYGKHPDWWPAYVAWHGQVYDIVKSVAPSVHVTTYMTHEWIVGPDGLLNQNNANIWRTLLPKIDSVAISSYPIMRFKNAPIPPAYFARPIEVAPNLPLLVAEFGVESGGYLTEQQQALLLQRMVWEFDYAKVKALIYYQPFDMNYLGQPPIFKDAWSRIGLARLNGTPKASYYFWSDLSKLAP